MENQEILHLILNKLGNLEQGQVKLEQGLAEVKADVAKLNVKVDKLEVEVTQIKIKLENVIEPSVKTICENQMKIIDSNKQLERIENNVETNTSNISILNIVVKEHSDQLNLLKVN